MLKALKTLPLGPFVIFVIAALSSGAIAVWPSEKTEGLAFWTFAPDHARMYSQAVEDWNESAERNGTEKVQLFVLSTDALPRRTQSGMWAGTPTSDLVEIERGVVSQFMSGPVESIGFHDLTDRLNEEGIYERINESSFGPWSSRGRIFGLPHDVHPVLLAYRADIAEQAGITQEQIDSIETWDDFERVMRPVMDTRANKDNQQRYLLGLWYTSGMDIEGLILQAGGGTFDAQGHSIIASDANAKVLARVVSWCVGPDRIAIDAPEWSGPGNAMKNEGVVFAALMPDWLVGTWKTGMAPLKGKLRLMPLPAWEPGGRRTSVMGGTMLAIPKTTRNFDSAWSFAKELYLSRDLAQQLFETNHIISPVIELWEEDFYDQKIAYFGGQRTGRLYIDQAPHVPFRTSSPFHQIAMQQIMDAASRLKTYASMNNQYDREALETKAKQLLMQAHKRIEMEMSRNIFIAGGDDE